MRVDTQETGGYQELVRKQVLFRGKDGIERRKLFRRHQVIRSVWKRAIPTGAMRSRRSSKLAMPIIRTASKPQAIAAAERFIKLHPNHINVDYAYYLKGLANFNDDLGLMGIVSEKILNQDMSERDPKGVARVI